MTFRSNPADIIIVLESARRLYQQCKNASDAYFEIGREIRALHTVLRHLKYEVQAPESILNRDRALYARDLAPLIADCRYTLEDLEELIRKYGGLRSNESSSSKQLRNLIKSSSVEMDRLGSVEMGQLGSVRVKLINHKTNITALLDTIQLSESSRLAATLDNHGGQLDIILDKVDNIAARMGQRASLITYDDDDEEDWKIFRRELVAEGFSSVVLTRHKDVLRAYVREIDQNGLLKDVPAQAKATQPILWVLEQAAQSPPSSPSPPSFNMVNTSSDSPIKELRRGEHTFSTRTSLDFVPQQSDFISPRLSSSTSPKLQSLVDNLGNPARIRSQRTGSLKDLDEHDVSISNLENQPRLRTLEGSSVYEASEASMEGGSIFSLPQSFSSKSSAHGTVGATREFVILLMENTQLRRLSPSLRQNFEFTAFRSKLHDLLRVFSRDLSRETLIPIEKESVRIFSQQRKRVAHTIGQEIFGLEDTPLLQSISQQQQLVTRKRIEKYLKDAAQVKGSSGDELSLHQEHMLNNNSSDDEDELEPFSNLEDVKKFLISSKAFKNLRVRINKLAAEGEESAIEMRLRHNVIELEREAGKDEKLSNIGVNQNPLSRTVIPESRTIAQAGRTNVFATLLRWPWFVHRLFRPKLEIGYRRLEWQCDCGMPLYGDFRGDPEEISKLVGEIQAHGYVVTQSGHGIKQMPANSGVTTGLNLVASASQGLSTSQTAQDPSLNSTGTTSRPLGGTRNPMAGSAVTTSPLPPVTNNSSKFVALCVNTGPFQKTYDEIDISASLRNTQMFHNFKKTYEACIGSRKNPLRRWLTQPIDIEFIQFAVEGLRRVYPIPGSPDCTICAHAEKKDGLVTARKYEPHLNGVALTHPPIPPHLFLHLWECPNDITPTVQNMWLNRLPKKLDEKLGKVCLATRPDGELILGWGVLVVEGLHRKRILRLTITIMALSMIISVVYSASTKDVSSGFAVGALLLGCWTLIIAALFSEWVVR
ncbi:hypothetical protein VE01_02435 [Pseudogymnoascus verrucosus]|uniref:Uncharacterized protein n=1 Tax=Pseudogymnoascus verrucosus TaxID=342668 RepID=A0A1B8GT76_9PEZI|nr:uncharacterized protein VE01_02435 [Pseudogymnoascus verrucosus]OBT99025.2 hypothetical protein VE01_02435 [Pseudogymnoascus verrucosus]